MLEGERGGVHGVGWDNRILNVRLFLRVCKTPAPQILFKLICVPSGTWLLYPNSLPQPLSQEQGQSFHLSIASLALCLVAIDAQEMLNQPLTEVILSPKLLTPEG